MEQITVVIGDRRVKGKVEPLARKKAGARAVVVRRASPI